MTQACTTLKKPSTILGTSELDLTHRALLCPHSLSLLYDSSERTVRCVKSRF